MTAAHARDKGQIIDNPAHGVQVLRTRRVTQGITAPAKEDVRRLIAAADPRFRPLLTVAALCGLRASEARGLRWQDVDLEKGTVSVRQRADAYNVIGEPKSAAGYRDVPAGPVVIEALRLWKTHCPKGDLDLVFPNRRGGIASHSNILKRHFRPLCQSLGLTLRWHDLRHFAISLWIEQGFTLKAVMTFAGHAAVQMTMERYGHLFPSPDHQAAMAEAEARLFGAPPANANLTETAIP